VPDANGDGTQSARQSVRRSMRPKRLCALMAVAIVGASCAGPARQPAPESPEASASTSAPGSVRNGELALAGPHFTALRMARARLCVLPDGVLVVNYLRSRFISWHEISKFSLRGWGFWWTPVGHVELKNGSSVPVLGIGRSSPTLRTKRARADDMIQELNDLLDEHRRSSV
jgi:hypothetical protein